MTNLRRSYKDSWGCFDVPAKRAELADATSVLNDPKAWPDHSKISRANQVAKSNSSLLDAFDRISKDIDFLIEIAALGEPVGAERAWPGRRLAGASGACSGTAVRISIRI